MNMQPRSTSSPWVPGSGLVALAAALLVLPFLVKNYRVFQFNLVLVYAIAVLGLNILTGFNGQISLGPWRVLRHRRLCRRHPDGPRRPALLGHAAASPVRCASCSAS
jgi:hypothetical protein